MEPLVQQKYSIFLESYPKKERIVINRNKKNLIM